MMDNSKVSDSEERDYEYITLIGKLLLSPSRPVHDFRLSQPLNLPFQALVELGLSSPCTMHHMICPEYPLPLPLLSHPPLPAAA